MIAASISVTLLAVVAILAAGAALVLSYRWIIAALSAAECALILVFAAGNANRAISVGSLIFWFAAAFIAAVIVRLLPEQVSKSRVGVPYMATGAIAGMMVGVALDTVAALVIGTAAGVLFGALIFGNTLAGSTLEFPSMRYFNYVLAKGLPLVVAMSIVGLTLSTCIHLLGAGI